MRNWIILAITVSALFQCPKHLFAQADVHDELSWSSIRPIPNAKGLAGPFVGIIDNQILVAGGANFPESPPWEGGTKIWYDSVYALNLSSMSTEEKQWHKVGVLPKPLGYGVSISSARGMICIGGSDAKQHYADVFELSSTDGILKVNPLPPCPVAIANSCGALVGDTIFIAGGSSSPDATNALKNFWSLDLSNPLAQWREHEPWPGPGRILAVAGTDNESFYLFSGAELTPDANGRPLRNYLRDAYRYHPNEGWRKLADMPRAAVAAPSPAPLSATGMLLVMGGDDGSLIGLQRMDQHPGFRKSALPYDSRNDQWTAEIPMNVSHVTTTIVRHGERNLLPTGEVRPGVRSPEVWEFRWKQQSISESRIK